MSAAPAKPAAAAVNHRATLMSLSAVPSTLESAKDAASAASARGATAVDGERGAAGVGGAEVARLDETTQETGAPFALSELLAIDEISGRSMRASVADVTTRDAELREVALREAARHLAAARRFAGPPTLMSPLVGGMGPGASGGSSPRASASGTSGAPVPYPAAPSADGASYPSSPHFPPYGGGRAPGPGLIAASHGQPSPAAAPPLVLQGPAPYAMHAHGQAPAQAAYGVPAPGPSPAQGSRLSPLVLLAIIGAFVALLAAGVVVVTAVVFLAANRAAPSGGAGAGGAGAGGAAGDPGAGAATAGGSPPARVARGVMGGTRAALDDVSGGTLDGQAVRAAVTGAAASIDACFAASELEAPNHELAVYVVDVAPSGVVTNVEAAPQGRRAVKLDACVFQTLRTVGMPRSRTGSVVTLAFRARIVD